MISNCQKLQIIFCKNEEEKKKLYDQIFDERTLSVYKEKFKLNEKTFLMMILLN